MTCLSSLSELNKRGTLRFFFFFFNLKSFIDLSLRDEIICLAVPGLRGIMQNL